jgi:hypothetical protein
MEAFRNIVAWYVQHKNSLDFVKDVLFAIGLIATFYGYIKFLAFLTQRGTLNKRQEMENDAKTYKEINDKLEQYVESFKATPSNMRGIGIRLLYIKNYPYNLDDDGFRQTLYYYFMSEYHKPSGYISSTGLYVMEDLWYVGSCIYYNPKNEKWFIDDKDLRFKNYHALKHKQLMKRIPFANILGYDFDADWSDKEEPVFYTKYKYYKWKLFADGLVAVTFDEEFSLAHTVDLKKSKRKRRIVRTTFRRLASKFKIYSMNMKRRKESKVKPPKAVKKDVS